MWGYFSVNLSRTCWVSSWRVSEPHQEKRISTGSGGPDDVGLGGRLVGRAGAGGQGQGRDGQQGSCADG